MAQQLEEFDNYYKEASKELVKLVEHLDSMGCTTAQAAGMFLHFTAHICAFVEEQNGQHFVHGDLLRQHRRLFSAFYREALGELAEVQIKHPYPKDPEFRQLIEALEAEGFTVTIDEPSRLGGLRAASLDLLSIVIDNAAALVEVADTVGKWLRTRLSSGKREPEIVVIYGPDGAELKRVTRDPAHGPWH